MIKLVVHAPPFSSGLLGTKDLKGRTPFPHCWTHHDGPFFGYVVGLVTGSVTGSLTKAEELELVLQRSKLSSVWAAHVLKRFEGRRSIRKGVPI